MGRRLADGSGNLLPGVQPSPLCFGMECRQAGRREVSPGGKHVSSRVVSIWAAGAWFVHLSGVTSYDINMEQQKVTVKGNVEPQAVLEKVSKTGKATSFWAA